MNFTQGKMREQLLNNKQDSVKNIALKCLLLALLWFFDCDGYKDGE